MLTTPQSLPRALVHFLMLASALATVNCKPEDHSVFEAGEALPGGAATNQRLLGQHAYSQPVAGMTVEQELRFFSGNSFFNQGWVQAPASTAARDGLGPTFNSRSCSGCHFKDGRGRPDLEGGELGLLLRLSVPGVGSHGGPRADYAFGGQLQDRSIPDVPAEGTVAVRYTEVSGSYEDGQGYSLRAPTYAIDGSLFVLPTNLMISPRVAPAMIGLGLLEGIGQARLDSLTDEYDADSDGISGRQNIVWDVRRETMVTGRFGWKAEQPTVEQQSAGAFLGDMGLTTNLFPYDNCPGPQKRCSAALNGGQPEVSDKVLDRVAFYSSTLAVPIRLTAETPGVLAGKRLFARVGCTGCHTPSHVTEANGVVALSEQTIWPYTDLLLHDMGEALSDNRPSFAAQGAEWRTPPLWGLSQLRAVNKHSFLLHDGRARNVEEAILWHAGEAEESANNFRALEQDERIALIEFVHSL